MIVLLAFAVIDAALFLLICAAHANDRWDQEDE